MGTITVSKAAGKVFTTGAGITFGAVAGMGLSMFAPDKWKKGIILAATILGGIGGYMFADKAFKIEEKNQKPNK